MEQLPSKFLEKAVEQLSTLPSIGKRSALRLALHLLKQEEQAIVNFASAIVDLKEKTKTCSRCHNLCDDDLCNICQNPNRDTAILCVVEDIRDIMAIENTMQFKGYYHVLGGIISPMEGIGPGDLTIAHLLERIPKEDVSEVILALNGSMEGETTSYYLYKKIAPLGVDVSSIARGIAVGEELEYTDEVTLGRSIQHRTPFGNDWNKEN